MEDNCLSFLHDLTIDLLSEDVIDNPFQLAVAEYSFISKTGKYVAFPTDAFQILNYMHPYRNDEAGRDFLRNIHNSYNKISSNLLKNVRNTEHRNFIKNRYELLRSLSIKKPVFEDLFLRCYEAGNSQNGDSLTLNSQIKYISESQEGDLICKLEKTLFLISDYPYYLCTFFNYEGSKEDTIACLSLFCRNQQKERIGHNVLEFMRRYKGIYLLESILDKMSAQIHGLGIIKNIWPDKITIFKKYQEKQEHLSASSPNKTRQKIIDCLQEIINTIEQFADSEEIELNSDKIKDINDFIESHSEFISTENLLKELLELQGKISQ